MAVSPISLREFDTDTLSPLGVHGAGTDKILLKISGNSILSSVFIKNIDVGATLDVEYFQTTGATEADGEKQTLSNHATFTPADNGVTNTILVTRCHNKPFLEVTVTGGTAEYAIYATVLSEAASDIDSALKKDGQVADLDDDKGIPIVCYNETTGLYELLRCPFEVTFTSPNTSSLFNKNIPLANTEVSQTLPSNAKRFKLQSRGNAIVKLSFTLNGTTAGNYWTIFPGTVYCEENIDSNITLYLNSSKANEDVEIVSWS